MPCLHITVESPGTQYRGPFIAQLSKALYLYCGLAESFTKVPAHSHITQQEMNTKGSGKMESQFMVITASDQESDFVCLIYVKLKAACCVTNNAGSTYLRILTLRGGRSSGSIHQMLVEECLLLNKKVS